VWRLAAGLVLLGASGVLTHFAIGAHPVLWIISLAGTSFLVALGYGLVSRRPSIEQAARCADAWFASKDLMISAWDQFQRVPCDRAPAAELVLSDADAKADAWREDLRRKSPPLPLRRYYAPWAIVVTGVFLECTLGATRTLPVPPRTPPVPAGGDAAAASAATASGILSWRADAPAAPAAVHPPDVTAADRRQAAHSATRRDAQSDPSRPGAASPSASSAAAADAARHPGTAQPANVAPPRVREGGDDVPVTFVDVARPRGDQAAGAAVDLESGSAGGAAGAAAQAAPAAKTIDLRSSLDRSPTQRAYVAAYLRSLEDRE
jgi:hypothetical protein